MRKDSNTKTIIMEGKTTAEKVVEKMMSGDGFSQWLGISIISIAEGKCK